jgi:diguanylate cyclase (GGDEF)-like protein
MSVNPNGSLPLDGQGGNALNTHNLEQLRLETMERFATLNRSQMRTRLFAGYITRMVQEMNALLTADVRRLGEGLTLPAEARVALEGILADCDRLEQAIERLTCERQRQLELSGETIRDSMRSFSSTMDELQATLLNKDLLERQSKVLSSIILSHERISRWKDFVQEILGDFYRIFPFDFFFIAFAGENALSLFIYYMGEYSETECRWARQKLSRRMLEQLGLPVEAALDIEEFQVLSDAQSVPLSEIELITVRVPEHTSFSLAGELGIALASAQRRTPLEASIIRSILSVMVMVVGSSKALSRTLTELEYFAKHDPLTGLGNRRYFNDMLDLELGRSERHSHEFSVMLLDLDDFKDINDSYGHLVGDQVLGAVAEVLKAQFRQGDLACRIGGDEFAVLLPETPPANATRVGEKVRRAIHDIEFTCTEGKPFRLTVSVGVGGYPGDARDINDLLASVDGALYRAKGMGKNSVCVLEGDEKELRTVREARTKAETLRRALKDKRIVPYFQPIVDLKSGEIHGYETLARMIEAHGGTTPADAFIETIEKYGLGRDLDRCIMEQSFDEVRRKLHGRESAVRVFINLSPREIQGRGVLDLAEKLCGDMGLEPGRIVLELTERDAIGDMSHMRRFLTRLRNSGFAFALDDFGSGYNSFHYLRELHFEYVKIDGAFVRNIVNSRIDYVLVDNLARMCRDLGMQTIAEYVESEEILEALKEMGIDHAQGYYLGMPVPEIVHSPSS